MRIRPALAGSYKALFHESGLPSVLLTLRVKGGKGDENRDAIALRLRELRLKRAIGVIDRPETERSSHYGCVPVEFIALKNALAIHDYRSSKP